MSTLRASILGGVDGVVTSFAIVAGSHAGQLSTSALLVIALSSLLADGLSMGISEFLSSFSTSTTSGTRRYATSARLGLACFASFLVCGLFPTLAYVYIARGRLLACAMFSLVELMVLGFLRTVFSGEEILLGVLQTAALGSAAGGAAYATGVIVHGLALGATTR